MPLCRSSVPARRPAVWQWADGACASLVAEYVARTERLAALAPRLASLAPPPQLRPPPRTRPLPADLEPEHLNLALELTRSILYEDADSIDVKIKSLDEDSLWNGKPQQYFESMNYGRAADGRDFEEDSLA